MRVSRPGAFRFLLAVAALGSAATQAATKPVQAQSASSVQVSAGADGPETVEIRNATYEVTGTQVPGRPADERLLLRTSTHSKQVLGDIGMEATVMLEAWRLGDDPRQKPLYAVNATGMDGHTLDNALFVASRGLEEVEWWSVYKLGTGQRLFDTYAPLLSFSISRETVQTRYVGLEVPPDDTADARLKQPNVVAVLTYASEDKVLREVLLTCDDPRRARLLRSYADVTRTVSLAEGLRTIRLSFSENYPSPPNTVEALITVRGDDLDLAHAKLPPLIHASAWRR